MNHIEIIFARECMTAALVPTAAVYYLCITGFLMRTVLHSPPPFVWLNITSSISLNPSTDKVVVEAVPSANITDEQKKKIVE